MLKIRDRIKEPSTKRLEHKYKIKKNWSQVTNISRSTMKNSIPNCSINLLIHKATASFLRLTNQRIKANNFKNSKDQNSLQTLPCYLLVWFKGSRINIEIYNRIIKIKRLENYTRKCKFMKHLTLIIFRTSRKLTMMNLEFWFKIRKSIKTSRTKSHWRGIDSRMSYSKTIMIKCTIRLIY